MNVGELCLHRWGGLFTRSTLEDAKVLGQSAIDLSFGQSFSLILQEFGGTTLAGEATQAGQIGGTPQVSPADWARVLGRLRREVGETAYRSWFRSMTVDRVTGGEGIIAVPTRFLRNWVATHYADRLLALWRSENQAVHRISFIVNPHHGRNGAPPCEADPSSGTALPPLSTPEAGTALDSLAADSVVEGVDDKGYVLGAARSAADLRQLHCRQAERACPRGGAAGGRSLRRPSAFRAL